MQKFHFPIIVEMDEDGYFWIMGRIDDVLPLLKVMRDVGLRVGLGTHIPEVIDYVEEAGWDIDFYMACFYNLNRKPRMGAISGGAAEPEERFLDEDRERMARRILATDKTVLGFKFLAAGRKCSTPETTQEAFRWAFAHIKPKDALVVGMFPKHSPQVRDNASLVEELS